LLQLYQHFDKEVGGTNRACDPEHS